MLAKNQVIDIIKNYMLQSQDENTIKKCQEMIEKLYPMPEDEFKKIVYNTLGENPDITSFNNWLMGRLNEPEHRHTDFIQLNRFASYNIAGHTAVLHVVPEHVTLKQIRNSGTYLVDALEQIKALIQKEELGRIDTIFAVSDILKIRQLQEIFKDLSFNVEKGDRRFTGRFKNPYQASLPTEILLSEEWEKTKQQFMEKKPTIKENDNDIEK